jgi:hypothetical protein
VDGRDSSHHPLSGTHAQSDVKEDVMSDDKKTRVPKWKHQGRKGDNENTLIIPDMNEPFSRLDPDAKKKLNRLMRASIQKSENNGVII